MMRSRRTGCLAALYLFLAGAAVQGAPKLVYVKKPTRQETITASLRASGLPALDGTWHYIGPFDNKDNKGFAMAYPPEKEIDLQKTYPGKDGETARWKV